MPITKLWSWRAVLTTAPVSKLFELMVLCNSLIQKQHPYSLLGIDYIQWTCTPGKSYQRFRIIWEHSLRIFPAAQLGQGYPQPLPQLISNTICKVFYVCMPNPLNSETIWNPLREAATITILAQMVLVDLYSGCNKPMKHSEKKDSCQLSEELSLGSI